jgi:hypothetical protein
MVTLYFLGSLVEDEYECTCPFVEKEYGIACSLKESGSCKNCHYARKIKKERNKDVKDGRSDRAEVWETNSDQASKEAK